MIKQIRTHRLSKIIASYLAIQLIVTTIQPTQIFALTSGPSQPEFNSFTPIGTSDMVNLSSGDFNYNIPIMDVGGYPLNLAYDSGITMDQEATWVGLGWNLNVGQINRNVRGLPDDFNGDELIYENNLKRNKTVGMTFKANAQAFGLEAGPKFGLTVQYNNYEGVSFKPSYGFSWDINDNVSVGMNLTTSATEGVSVSPSVNIHRSQKQIEDGANSLSGSIGVGYNSRQGLTSFNMSASTSRVLQKGVEKVKNDDGTTTDRQYQRGDGLSGSGTVSFVNNTFTPKKRTAFNNTNLTFAASVGGDFWGIDGEVGLDAFATVQVLEDDGAVTEKGFGYQFTENASKHDVLDFNKENDEIVSKNTLALSATNYTYDIYSINGQGIGGMFRPFRGNVGHVYDRYIQDQGAGGSLGVEIEGATGFHVGVDLKYSPSESHTGLWNTNATSFFKPPNPASNKLDYESVYFKSIGELRVDDENSYFQNTLGGYDPVALTIGGSSAAPGKYAQNKFRQKIYVDNAPEYNIIPTNGFTGKLKRVNREKRNQAITKFTKKEAQDIGAASLISTDGDGKSHHTAGMHILQPDGSTYVYGETAYNKLKQEVSFTVNGAGNCADGVVSYNGSENTLGNSSGIDNYFNRITTPEYAHTYLLSSVISSDYEDITGNGVSDDDLGAYTKFNYVNKDSDFQWRIPYDANTASFNEGLKTNQLDQKGSYIYGTKELKYIETIQTKTHVAVFDLSRRKDGYGVNSQNGGGNAGTASRMYKLNTISLYSKPEYKLLNDGDTSNDDGISPIKVAHFVYDYDLVPGVHNNFVSTLEDNELSNNRGKLTLKQVYFTYRDSKMGKYTPYEFQYGKDYDGDGEVDNNYPYSLKAYDVWGNYKPNDGGCSVGSPITTPEFPFVQQTSQEDQDKYASAWSLSRIELPSGGKLDVEYESDDYRYVQDRKAMEMFKVVGVTTEGNSPSAADIGNNTLYNPLNYVQDGKYLIVEVPEEGLTPAQFQEKYIGSYIDKPIYFRFLLQMVKNQSQKYDYVEGYFNIDQNADFATFSSASKNYAAIPMQFSRMEGGTDSGEFINPISKSGWYFARQFLNRQAYGLTLNPGSEKIGDIARALGASLSAVSEFFRGPNKSLRLKQCARKFEPAKSWIRLQHSGDQKLGGGVRVKSVQMHDQWDQMLGITSTDENVLKRYRAKYGQEYDYSSEDGLSSGVATFEPNMSKENPFVQPFYHVGEDLVAPREISYTEKPFGVSFFPSPTVTYGRVTVKNLERAEGENQVSKHATGKVINEFFTSRDFPTIADYTTLNQGGYYSNENQAIEQLIEGLLGLEVETETELTLSQGFVVRTNDMNGKTKKQSVYSESDAFISGVDYEYSVTDDGNKVNSNLPVINQNGEVSTDKEIGVHYDVITDFRESYSKSRTFGIHGNVAGFVIGIFPIIIPTAFPERATHEKRLQTTTTTKVVHSTGILKKKTAYDLGSRVSTENLAWDENSGQVLLTKTVNEYDDQYFNFTYPAHWYHKNMGKATNNIGIEGDLTSGDVGEPDNPNRHLFSLTNGNGDSAKDIFTLGDELFVYGKNAAGNLIPDEKLWVASIDNNNVTLMNRSGKVINQSCSDVTKDDLYFKIVRSGHRNLQSATMASVTSMTNPIDVNNDGLYNNLTPESFNYAGQGTNPRIINSSAVAYTDYWKLQRERNLPIMPTSVNASYDEAIQDGSEPLITPENYGFNPYVYNARGDWKAIKSYAYLTGRNGSLESNQGSSPRVEGFFTKFNPYYTLNNSGVWVINDANWTFASQVTQTSPYGAELENADALERFSAAQYGYNYTLPTAVGSNSEYRELGFDGFEDYAYDGNDNNTTAHFAMFTGQANTELTDATSHTGRYSLKINGGNDLQVSSPLGLNDFEVTQPECPDDPIVVTDPGWPDTCMYGVFPITVTGEEGATFNFNFVFEDGGNPITTKQVNIDGDLFVNDNSGTVVMTIPTSGTLTFNVIASMTGCAPSIAFGAHYSFNVDGGSEIAKYNVCDDDCAGGGGK